MAGASDSRGPAKFKSRRSGCCFSHAWPRSARRRRCGSSVAAALAQDIIKSVDVNVRTAGIGAFCLRFFRFADEAWTAGPFRHHLKVTSLIELEREEDGFLHR